MKDKNFKYYTRRNECSNKDPAVWRLNLDNGELTYLTYKYGASIWFMSAYDSIDDLKSHFNDLKEISAEEWVLMS